MQFSKDLSPDDFLSEIETLAATGGIPKEAFMATVRNSELYPVVSKWLGAKNIQFRLGKTEPGERTFTVALPEGQGWKIVFASDALMADLFHEITHIADLEMFGITSPTQVGLADIAMLELRAYLREYQRFESFGYTTSEREFVIHRIQEYYNARSLVKLRAKAEKYGSCSARNRIEKYLSTEFRQVLEDVLTNRESVH